ncbi:MAG TPA: MFS transporter [Prolixibacteraceae bacterium]
MFIGAYSQFQVPPLANKIIPALNLTNVQFSSIMTAPMLPAVLFSIIAGILADRFGVKRVVAVGLIIASAGILLRPLANNYLQMLIFMALAGFCNAFINANAAKMLGDWFPPEQISKAMGILLTSGTLGMTLGMGTAAMFPTVNSVYITTGVFCSAATIIWLAFMQNTPQKIEVQESISVTQYILVAAKSKALWLVGVELMLILGCTMTLTGFLPKALAEVKGIDPVTAGLLSSMIMLGTLLSSLLSPIISQWIGLFRPYLVAIGLLSAFGTFFAWQVNGVLIWVAMLLTGVGLGATMPIYMSFPMMLKEIGPVYAGSAGGLIATVQLIGAIVIPTYIITPLAGNNYNMIFGMAAMCMILMSILALFLPELGPKSRKASTTISL